MSKDIFIPGITISYKRKYSERLKETFLKAITESLPDITEEYLADTRDKKVSQQEDKSCR